MAQGSAPGERRGGRQKGTPNKKKKDARDSLNGALNFALQKLTEDQIKAMSPATILRFAMHVAAAHGHGLAATSFAEKAAPYFDPKLTSTTVDVNTKRTVQDYTDAELERLAGSSLLIEGSPVGGGEGVGEETAGEREPALVH